MGTSWGDLAGLALARQFPETTPETAPDVAGRLARIGAVQSQTARSPFLALAARFPGTTRDEVTTAYASGAIVRGTTVRGTVHTATPVQYDALRAATRVGWGRPVAPSPSATARWCGGRSTATGRVRGRRSTARSSRSSTRHDLAWWSGLGLRVIDQHLVPRVVNR